MACCSHAAVNEPTLPHISPPPAPQKASKSPSCCYTAMATKPHRCSQPEQRPPEK